MTPVHAEMTKPARPAARHASSVRRARRDMTSQFAFQSPEEALKMRESLQAEIYSSLEQILAVS